MGAQVYQHPASGLEVIPTLNELLPYPLPLLGRIKFHHRSSSSQILATFPPSKDDLSVISKRGSHGSSCFAIAFLDRTRRPETECWLFSSGEIPGRCSLSSDARNCVNCRTAVLAVVDAAKKSRVPASVHGQIDIANANEAVLRAIKGEVILFGALHDYCTQIIQDATPNSVVPPPVPGIDLGYMKYLFRPSTLPAPQELPHGLRWGRVRPEDFALVRSRTSIPRQDATLALLPSLAIFRESEADGAPIAWAFRGPDASLTSLHTEPEYRGQGLAKILVGKLFRNDGSVDTAHKTFRGSTFDAEEPYFHADVALNNESSRAVCRGLGGKEGWIVHWIRIDTTKD